MSRASTGIPVKYYYVRILRTRQVIIFKWLYTSFMPRLPQAKKAPVLDSTAKEIGSRIAGLRKQKGITQKELAEKIGVTRTMVTDYECGRVRLYDEILARLAIVLECSADMILGLKPVSKIDSSPQLKFTRRIKELEQLPEIKQKAILKTLDDLIRANQ